MSIQFNNNAILVSYFHDRIGPTPLFFTPEDLTFELQSLSINDTILRILEFFNTEGIIILKFPKYWALNKLFEINSPLSRRRQKESVLLSYIHFSNNLEPNLSIERLNNIEKQFSDTISLLQDFTDNYMALYIKDRMKNNIDVQKSFKVWKKIINELYERLNVL